MERSEGSDTTPTQNTPCFGVRAAVCDSLSKGECVPAFACESERGAFVPEVLKTVWTMCWKRWYDCVSCAFHGFFEDEKESRRKALALFRANAHSQQPAVRAAARVCGFWKLTLFSRFPELFDAKFEKSRRKVPCHKGLLRRSDMKSSRFAQQQRMKILHSSANIGTP